MELTRLAARLLWNIAARAKDGEPVRRTTIREFCGSSVSTVDMQVALDDLLRGGLLVQSTGVRLHRAPAPTLYMVTDKGRALDLKQPRRGNLRSGEAWKISVRLPPELRRQIEAAADANDCALNAEIIRRLTASFAEKIHAVA